MPWSNWDNLHLSVMLSSGSWNHWNPNTEGSWNCSHCLFQASICIVVSEILHIADCLGVDSFMFSSGWIDRCKRRQHYLKKFGMQSRRVDSQAANDRKNGWDWSMTYMTSVTLIRQMCLSVSSLVKSCSLWTLLLWWNKIRPLGCSARIINGGDERTTICRW